MSPSTFIGVAHLDTHHLITATDAQYRRPFTVGTDDGLRTTVATQLVEVVERGLGARQDDDISLEQVVDIIGIEEVDAGILFEGVEVGIVREVLQHDHSHVDLAQFELPRFLGECHTVFFLDMDILEIGNNAQDGDATEVFEHATALVEEAQVATEFIDDDALDELAVFRRLEGDAAIDGGEDTPTINVAHEDDIGLGMTRHGEVHQIGIAEVDLGDTARTLHHNGVVLS